MRSVFLAVAAFFLAAARPAPVLEPPGLWQGAMHGATPNTLKGARVVDTEAVAQLRARLHLLLIDVAELEKKPPSLAKDIPWMPTHRTIPGAVWLAGAGFGTSDSGYAAAYNARIADLAGHDLDRSIVVFCHPHCWGSWNAAKRLVVLGYTHVYWYAAGVEGWQSGGHNTQVVKPDPLWQKALAKMKPESKLIREGQN